VEAFRTTTAAILFLVGLLGLVFAVVSFFLEDSIDVAIIITLFASVAFGLSRAICKGYARQRD